MAFPTNLAPIVGQQITLTASSSTAVMPRVQLLRQRADAGECDLVAKAEIDDVEVGFVYVGSGFFKSDRRALPPIQETVLRLLATHFGRPVTYTGAPFIMEASPWRFRRHAPRLGEHQELLGET